MEHFVFRYPRPGANFHVYWVLVLATAQVFIFQAAREFAAASTGQRLTWSGLALLLLLLPVGLLWRRFAAYLLSLVTLIFVTMLAANTLLQGSLIGAFRLSSRATGVPEPLLDRLVSTPLLILLLGLSLLALVVGIFLASPDFDRLRVRHVARLMRGLTDAHHYFETGRRAARQGQWATAVLHWQRAVGKEPRRLLYVRTLGEAYAHLGFFERSVDMLQTAQRLATDPVVRAELTRQIRDLQARQVTVRTKDETAVRHTATHNQAASDT